MDVITTILCGLAIVGIAAAANNIWTHRHTPDSILDGVPASCVRALMRRLRPTSRKTASEESPRDEVGAARSLPHSGAPPQQGTLAERSGIGGDRDDWQESSGRGQPFPSHVETRKCSQCRRNTEVLVMKLEGGATEVWGCRNCGNRYSEEPNPTFS